MPIETVDETGLVIPGGGALGAYAVGAMKALLRTGLGGRTIDPDILTGTSVGAFNAAFLVSYADRGLDEAIRYLEEVWLDRISSMVSRCGNGIFRVRFNPLPFLNPSCFLRDPSAPLRAIFEDNLTLAQDLMTRLIRVGTTKDTPLEELFPIPSEFIDTSPLERLVKETLRPEEIVRSKKKIVITATRWHEKEPGSSHPGLTAYFSNGDMEGDKARQAVMSSTALPAIFPPGAYGDNFYVDGGVSMNTPLRPAVVVKNPATNHLVLHVIHYASIFRENDVYPVPDDIFAIIDRLLLIFFEQAIQENVKRSERDNLNLVNFEITQRLLDLHKAGGSSRLDGRHGGFLEEVDEIFEEIGHRKTKKAWLTIHLYQPGGPLDVGLLDFERPKIGQLIERGFEDAKNHDCDEAGCLLPFKYGKRLEDLLRSYREWREHRFA